MRLSGLVVDRPDDEVFIAYNLNPPPAKKTSKTLNKKEIFAILKMDDKKDEDKKLYSNFQDGIADNIHFWSVRWNKTMLKKDRNAQVIKKNGKELSLPFDHSKCFEFLKNLVYTQDHLDHVMPLLLKIRPVGSTMPDELGDFLTFAVFEQTIKVACDWRSDKGGNVNPYACYSPHTSGSG